MAGPGKTASLLDTPRSSVWLLYNFDIGSSSLKPEHRGWLAANVSPLQQRRGDISFSTIGLASRTGNDKFNARLSEARGAAVQRAVYLLNPQMLRDTSEVFFGEKAAQLIGIRDGVEDERWRGVVLSIFEGKPAQFKTVQPKTRVLVPRRRSVVAVLSQDDGAMIGGIEDGGAGFRAGQAINRMRNPQRTILSETTQEVDESFWLLRVTAEEQSVTSGIPNIATTTINYLHVQYEWGPPRSANGLPARQEYVIKSNVGFGVPQTRVHRMGPVEAGFWLNNPVGTYDRLPK